MTRGGPRAFVAVLVAAAAFAACIVPGAYDRLCASHPEACDEEPPTPNDGGVAREDGGDGGAPLEDGGAEVTCEPRWLLQSGDAGANATCAVWGLSPSVFVTVPQSAPPFALMSANLAVGAPARLVAVGPYVTAGNNTTTAVWIYGGTALLHERSMPHSNGHAAVGELGGPDAGGEDVAFTGFDIGLTGAGTMTQRLGVLEGIADGGVDRFWTLAANRHPDVPMSAIRVMDADADGKLDLLVGYDGGAIFFRRNEGRLENPGAPTLGFDAGVSLLEGRDVRQLTSDRANQRLLAVTSDGAFWFSSGPTFPNQAGSGEFLRSGIRRAATEDVDGDGALDLVFAHENGELRVLGTAHGEGCLKLVGRLSDVAISDVDRDGQLDVVATAPDSRELHVLRMTETGAQSATVAFPGRRPDRVALEDFDGDGIVDIAVSFEDSSDLSLLRGTCQ